MREIMAICAMINELLNDASVDSVSKINSLLDTECTNKYEIIEYLIIDSVNTSNYS